jgi:NitT/TauT family transport system ATP-binding protein
MFEMRQVSLNFGPARVLDAIDFCVRPGERIGLLGASGSGKSTLLKLAAGVLKASQGACINSFRHSLLVFQEPRLLPWRRIHENIQIPLRAAGCTKQEAHRRAHHWLERVGLPDCANSWPSELSGGMAQRASLARAFALEPDFLLLDEPFSALDPALRIMLGNLCTDFVRDTGAALLCISHHPQELVRIVDHCVVLASGQLQPFES